MCKSIVGYRYYGLHVCATCATDLQKAEWAPTYYEDEFSDFPHCDACDEPIDCGTCYPD